MIPKNVPKLKMILMPKEKNQQLFDEMQLFLAKTIVDFKQKMKRD